MSDDARRYTEEEFERILSKASELAGSPATVRPPADGLTLAEMKSIAAEVGLDPDVVDRAARTVAAGPRDSLKQRVFGGPFVSRRDFILPVGFEKADAERLLTTARAAMRSQGVGEANASGMSWTSTEHGVVFVSAQPEGEGTRVQVVVDNRRSLILPLILGPAGLYVSGYIAVVVGGGTPVSGTGALLPYAILAAGGLASTAGVLASLRKIGRRTREALENLIGAITRALGSESAH